MKVEIEHMGKEVTETLRVVLREYHAREADEYIESLINDGWTKIDGRFHSINATVFTFERRRPLDEEMTVLRRENASLRAEIHGEQEVAEVRESMDDEKRQKEAFRRAMQDDGY